MLLVVSAQGCGFRSSEELQVETPLMLSGLPGGGSVTARVANCLPLGNDGKYFLIGASLYTHGNVWGIADPPEDWGVAAKNAPVGCCAGERHCCSEAQGAEESLALQSFCRGCGDESGAEVEPPYAVDQGYELRIGPSLRSG